MYAISLDKCSEAERNQRTRRSGGGTYRPSASSDLRRRYQLSGYGLDGYKQAHSGFLGVRSQAYVERMDDDS
jgi:hypothetical protein